MRRIKEDLRGWDLYQRAVTMLLAVCAVMLTAYVALTWSYLSAISRDMNILTSNQSESGRALLAIKEQQAAANTRLDAITGELSSNLNTITEELHALNEKASVAADVSPPAKDSTQR